MSLPPVLSCIDADRDAALARLFDLLRIPSISTDPAYARDVARAAEWLAGDLAAIGFDASVRPTAGHPMVIAHWRGKTGPGPRVLFYGHYDVQPVDPLDLWETPPFEPRLAKRADGSEMIVARGAADDKGQVMTFIEAARAFIAETGGLPLPVSILLEGEEESGSANLVPFLEENRAELAADLALVCDTDMWDRETPAITATLRGLVGEEVIVRCATHDLHSGLFGGAAENPIRVLAKILAALHDADGRVTLPGFYDGVGEPPADIKAQWDALSFDERAFLAEIGLSTPAGEKGRSVLETIWSRPTCEFNGILGGYAGEGFKTVLPAKAEAKVSFRLVGGQDPVKIRESFRAFVRERLPPDAKVEFRPHGGSPAARIALDGPWLAAACRALEAEWGRPAVVKGSGGSIPVVGDMKRVLGLDSLLIGFGLDDDRIHSPNEKYELTSFRKGTRSWARVLAALAG